MNYYDRDFYDEPSEFEQKVDELKETLMDSVKDEHKQEVDRLRKENAELQEVKRNLESIKREYNQKCVEIDMQKRDLLYEVRKERLAQLMGDFQVELFKAYPTHENGEKCDKCDENRYIHYKSPQGKNQTEKCDCSKGRTVYKPTAHVCSNFESRSGKFIAWYKEYKDADGMRLEELSFSDVPRLIYNGERFEDIKERYFTVYFKTEEECQTYCDWLTEQEGKKGDQP
ncbi:hypothetical protein [Paenibacillus kribbensis]|uniref:hypothetical protein n=1 Tax=Paenibacillus kribbensis TaxID=172713 RepID=UPI000838D75E|nr:hypothetical protein [Paenibacillus kribbensis]